MTIYSIENEAGLNRLIDDLMPHLKAEAVFALHGDLGAGKSTLARQIIRRLMDNPELEVPSPTFTLVQEYEMPHSTIHHYDLYRMKDETELDEIGWDDAQNGLMLIEWPEKAGAMLPKKRHDLIIAFGSGPNERIIDWILPFEAFLCAKGKS